MTKYRLKKLLVLSTMLASSIVLSAGAARAACTGTPTTGADTIDCVGPTAPTFNSNEGDDVITLDGVTAGALTFDPGDPASGALNLAAGRTVMTGVGDDVVNLSGVINFGAGDLLISGNNGDSGDDIINFAAGTRLNFDNGFGADLGNSVDTVNLAGAATVDGFFDMGGGDDVLVGSGASLDLVGSDAIFLAGAGADVIDLGALSVAGVAAESNNQLVSVFLDGGDDVLRLNGGVLAGGISGSSGNDYIELVGVNIGGNVGLGDGADDLVVGGGTVVTGGIGAPGYEDGSDNILINNAIIGFIPFDAGEPRTSPSVASNDSGAVVGGVSIFGGADADVVAIFGGSVGGEINLADGGDTLVIDAGADEYTGVTDTDGAPGTVYLAPLVPVALGGDGTARTAIAGAAITDTPIVFNGGGGSDTAELFDLARTEDLIFLDVEQANFYGQSFSLDLDDNAGSGYYLKTDAGGTNSVLTQTDGDLDLGSGSLIKVFANNTVTMSDGAVDDSIDVVNLNLQGGSVLLFDADTTGGGYDENASDYFIVNNVTLNDLPNAADAADQVEVTVNLIGATSLSGSRRLIDDAGSATLDDPGLAATVMASETYGYVNDASTAARSYWLQEQGDSLYLLWTTNLNEETTAGYIGAPAGATGPATAALGLGLAAAPMAVGTYLADLSGADAGPGQRFAQAEPDASGYRERTCIDRPGFNLWADADGVTGGLGGSDYSSISARFGVEADVGRKLFDDCGRLLAGAFAYLGHANIDAADGASSGADTYGAGLYLRFSSEDGVYGSVYGHAGRGDVDTVNPVMGSTAAYDGDLYGFGFNGGRKFAITDEVTGDVRGYLNYSRFASGAFADSMGLVIDGIGSETLVMGVDIGAERDFGGGMSGFGRLGLRYTNFDGAIAASGTLSAFSTRYVSATTELGVSKQINDATRLTLSATGEFGKDIALYGARARLQVKF